MAWRKILAGVVLVLVLAAQRARAAELTPINFVSSGSGGIVEVIRFSQKQGFFKKQGLDMTMIYVPSGVLAAIAFKMSLTELLAMSAEPETTVCAASTPLGT